MKRCVRGRGRISIQNRAAKAGVLVCAMALALAATVQAQPVPDTILLPDSLGPLRPPYHLAFGSSTDNIYVASESSDIMVVDGNTFQRIKRINTGTPVGAALLVSQHNKLYCSYPQQGRIGVIDCATNGVIDSIDVGTRPKLLCYSSGSDKLYCGDTIDKTISVIDCATNVLLKVIQVGKGLAVMAYDPTTDKVYAGTRDALLGISCSADSIIASIGAVKSARGLCVNKRRQKLYAVGRHYSFVDTIYVVSTQSDSLTAEMPCGLEPSPSLACNEAADRLYVAVNGDGNLSEFDCVGDTLARLGPLQYRSVGLACDSLHNRLFNLCQENDAGLLVVLDCTTLLPVSSTLVGHNPAVLQSDMSRYWMMCVNRSTETSALTVFDYKGDSSCVRGATPLSGWRHIMSLNPATGRLYDRWGAGVGGGVGVIDEQTKCVVTQAFLPGIQGEMTYSRTSNKLYFQVTYGAFGEQRGLGVMDGAGDSLRRVVEMGDNYGDAFPCWCPDGNKVYSFAEAGARLYIAVIDCYADSVVRTLDVYDLVRRFEYLDNGRMLCNVSSRLDLIDTQTDSVVVDSAITGVYAVAHTGDGSKVYLVRSGRLEVRSSSTLALLSAVDWPYCEPSWAVTLLVYSDTTRKLYWFAGDSALAVDAVADTVEARIGASTWYRGACIDHTGRYLFTGVYHDSVVCLRVYDTRSDSVVAEYPSVQYGARIMSSSEQHCVYVGSSDMILVYPDAPPGIQETPKAEVRTSRGGPTVVSRVLSMGEATGRKSQAANLMDAAGRKVMNLRPGANDVRALAPGVYFVVEGGGRSEQGGAGIRKILIAR